MIQQTPSKNNESCIPDTYREILDYRPSSRPYYGDKCCDVVCFIGLSPVILPVWMMCCLGVTAKKTKNACFHCSVSTKVNDSVIVINEQPK
jgi:hypothetical protein